uniref:collagen alpha-1(I) chain-like n=1 Tax=Nyctereutes procyonoides TaxID=34880 RepID=UPI002443901B|nr:collagen alpha-1(I) chain-like [Nyctereutes procyonoides]
MASPAQTDTAQMLPADPPTRPCLRPRRCPRPGPPCAPRASSVPGPPPRPPSPPVSPAPRAPRPARILLLGPGAPRASSGRRAPQACVPARPPPPALASAARAQPTRPLLPPGRPRSPRPPPRRDAPSGSQACAPRKVLREVRAGQRGHSRGASSSFPTGTDRRGAARGAQGAAGLEPRGKGRRGPRDPRGAARGAQGAAGLEPRGKGGRGPPDPRGAARGAQVVARLQLRGAGGAGGPAGSREAPVSRTPGGPGRGGGGGGGGGGEGGSRVLAQLGGPPANFPPARGARPSPTSGPTRSPRVPGGVTSSPGSWPPRAAPVPVGPAGRRPPSSARGRRAGVSSTRRRPRREAGRRGGGEAAGAAGSETHLGRRCSSTRASRRPPAEAPAAKSRPPRPVSGSLPRHQRGGWCLPPPAIEIQGMSEGGMTAGHVHARCSVTGVPAYLQTPGKAPRIPGDAWALLGHWLGLQHRARSPLYYFGGCWMSDGPEGHTASDEDTGPGGSATWKGEALQAHAVRRMLEQKSTGNGSVFPSVTRGLTKPKPFGDDMLSVGFQQKMRWEEEGALDPPGSPCTSPDAQAWGSQGSPAQGPVRSRLVGVDVLMGEVRDSIDAANFPLSYFLHPPPSATGTPTSQQPSPLGETLHPHKGHDPRKAPVMPARGLVQGRGWAAVAPGDPAAARVHPGAPTRGLRPRSLPELRPPGP